MHKSTAASVWPERMSTPPSFAISGKIWPGRTKSSAPILPFASARTVFERGSVNFGGTAAESDKRRVEKLLYEARKDRPELKELIMCHPGDNLREIWLVKRSTDMSDIA